MQTLLIEQMRKIKRRIKVGNQNFDIWLGITQKSAGKINVIKLHYYPGDPANSNMKPVAIKSGFRNEQEAIEYGKSFMADLYKNAIRRNSSNT
jgi:hypothetical protein